MISGAPGHSLLATVRLIVVVMRNPDLRQWIRNLAKLHIPHSSAPLNCAPSRYYHVGRVVQAGCSRSLSAYAGSQLYQQHPESLQHWQHLLGVRSRDLNIFSVFNKEARAKEQARLQDELNRGYFDDLRDMRKTGGKVAVASTNLTPVAAAPKFASLVVHIPKGATLALPLEEENASRVTLICMAFRAHAQSMVVSWSLPFARKFSNLEFRQSIQVFEVSVIESYLLSLWPIKSLLLRTMKGADGIRGEEELQRQVVYAFGDTYFLRKALGIPNLLSGYVFLLDRKGRVRWRASGMATEAELASMMSCTSRLLEEQSSKRIESVSS